MIDKGDITAVILAGGVGSRLRTVTDIPKPVVPVRGRPYLFYVLEALKYQGIRRAVICAGYRSDVLVPAVEKWNPGLELAFAIEPELLGTGGALRFASGHIGTSQALILNGDSFCDAPLDPFLEFHADHPAAVSMLAVSVPDTARYGRLRIGDGSRLEKFEEKGPSGQGWINAGVYLAPAAALARIPETTPCSLEKEVFPLWLEQPGIFAFPVEAPFLDIGTPETYAQREEFLGAVRERRQARAREGMFGRDTADASTLLRTGVGVLLFNERNEVLLEKRADCGLWGLPGGAIHPGESVTATAIREVREETGLEIRVEGLFGVYSELPTRIIRYPDNGDMRQLVDIVVRARTVSGEIVLSPESDEVVYFPIDRLPPFETVVPPLREALQHLIRQEFSNLY